MKKMLAIMLGIMCCVLLTACGDKNVDTSESGQEEVEVVTMASLTIEDLDLIDEKVFPRSYSYEVYNWENNEATDTWEYTYPEDLSHTLLIPVHATMASREVISSAIEDGMIYTNVKWTLQDGTEVMILYINDPITLEYVAASVNTEVDTTLYTFYY